MSVNLFAYFEVGRRALAASQAALDVAGVNIANVNTPGFSRRQLDITTVFPQRVPGGFLGQGVDVARLHRSRDTLIAEQILGSLGTSGGLTERRRSLSVLESVLGPVDGAPIPDALSRLSQALTDVASRPENLATRQAAVDAASTLAANIRAAYRQVS
ncbi:MAG: flagellar basal body protein [Acidobacteriota bacterium]